MTTKLLSITLCALLAACGGDDEPAPKKSNKKATSKKPTKKPSAGGKKTVGGYTKVEDVVAQYEKAYGEAPEKAELRASFGPDVFIPDPAGDENRDPFRSYLIEPIIEDDRKVMTEQCKRKDQLKATNESLKNLSLTGIIRRGTSSVAQFRDSRGDMHLIKQGDCVGSEKAKVKRIFSGYVETETIPPNMVEGGQTIVRQIPLHPDQKLPGQK